MGNASAKIYIISISHISLHCFIIILHFFLLFGILSGHNSSINYELERMINKIIYIQHFVEFCISEVKVGCGKCYLKEMSRI